ncbi:MAG: hypothetical protein OHK93_000144 [Ramalina farinacea]|uniref:Mog1p/PsbP-like protein n=1 Tax=Ramalina farinacea TaxID=258253 RepID=A0AA43TS90_9LECA|nr:hypothetical protein [Ramalina farinacea]
MPAHFADVSDIRQIPDNQEVYLDTTGFTSVTIDLCERVPSPPPNPSSSSPPSATTDGNASADGDANPDHYALTYHFFDIVAAEDTKRIYHTTHNITLPGFPTTTPISSLLALTTPPPPPSAEGRGPNEAKWVCVIMTLIRLVTTQTDMLVVVNVPCVPAAEEDGDGEEVVDFERGVYGRRVREGREVMEGVVGSLRVVDWGLFGDGGDGEGEAGSTGGGEGFEGV